MTETNSAGSVPPPEATAPVPPLPQPPSSPIPPPAPTYQAGAPKQGGNFKRGFGIGFGASVGFGAVMVIGSVISSMIFALLVAGVAVLGKSSNSADSLPLTVAWGKEGAKNTIRAIEIKGPILADVSDGSLLMAATYGYEVAGMIDRLGDESAGLALLINTPGGSVNGSWAIADAVKRYQERTGKKVVAYVRGTSASGGMMAMAGADEIIADRGSVIGSVGVIMGPLSRYKDVKSVTAGTNGVVADSIEQFYITQGKGKDMGNPFRDLSQEERANLNGITKDMYELFVNWVSEGRKIPASTIKNDYGAFLFESTTAVKNKYADAVVEGPEDGFSHIAKTMGLDPNDTKIEKAVGPGFLGLLFGMENRVYGQAPAAVSVAGEPARANSRLCGGTPEPLVYWGNPATICG